MLNLKISNISPKVTIWTLWVSTQIFKRRLRRLRRWTSKWLWKGRQRLCTSPISCTRTGKPSISVLAAHSKNSNITTQIRKITWVLLRTLIKKTFNLQVTTQTRWRSPKISQTWSKTCRQFKLIATFWSQDLITQNLPLSKQAKKNIQVKIRFQERFSKLRIRSTITSSPRLRNLSLLWLPWLLWACNTILLTALTT